MAVLLYGSPVESLRRFHPSGIPLNVFDRLADHPSVVGIKLTHPMNPATAFEICERLSNRLIMGPCNFDHIPVLAKNYKNVQWSGLWITDALQSPEKPYAVEMMDLVVKGRMAGRDESVLADAAADSGDLRLCKRPCCCTKATQGGI